MSEEKKVAPAVNNVKNNSYKVLRDLTNDDLKSFPVVKVELTRSESKYGISYKWSIPFGLAHLESKHLDEIGYFTILNVQNIEPTGVKTYINAAQRFIVGTTKDGKTYHQVQLIIGHRCFLTRLINDNELRLANSWIKQEKMNPIIWIEVPVVLEDDLLVNIGSNEEN